MAIGIGGAGCKIAVKVDENAVLVNVSETELSKVEGGSRKMLATLHDDHGQYHGSRKDPSIGQNAYQSIRGELLNLIRGEIVICSAGGGTGNGIVTGILKDLTAKEDIGTDEKTMFAFVLPYAEMEANEFVINTSEFLSEPVAAAIDAGNTGNIFLFSNAVKFKKKISEDKYNGMIAKSLQDFLAIPEKNRELRLLEEHIDEEDFKQYLARPFFNHFTMFSYKPEESFEKQLTANYNKLLLKPEEAIEAMFLLEVPEGGDSTMFYDINEYFNGIQVRPMYSVVENTAIDKPRVTVSLLYSRMPAELVSEFNEISETHVDAKIEKTVNQFVSMPRVAVNMEKKAKQVVKKQGGDEDVLAILARIGKL